MSRLGYIVLLLVGVIFLLSNLGVVHFKLGSLLHTWWPLILIVVGAVGLLGKGK